MSDLISREELNNHISYIDSTDLPENECLKVILVEDIPSIPSADIMECARAIKDYCRDRDNLDEPCEDCPFHFYDGFAGFCVLNYGLYPNEWFKPDKRNLPEGEKGGSDDNT